MIINANDIVTWLDTLSREELYGITAGCVDRDNDDSTLDQLSGYGFSESDADWQSYIERITAYREVRDDKGFLVSIELNSAEDLDAIDRATAEYDDRVWGNMTPAAETAWDKAVLPFVMRDYSGDHEDYNGSYLSIMADILRAYLNKEG